METTTPKEILKEVLELGLNAVRSTNMFGLTSRSEARKNALLAFVGGSLIGGGVATFLLMRGNTASDLRERVGDIKDDVVSKVDDLKQKMRGTQDTSGLQTGTPTS